MFLLQLHENFLQVVLVHHTKLHLQKDLKVSCPQQGESTSVSAALSSSGIIRALFCSKDSAPWSSSFHNLFHVYISRPRFKELNLDFTKLNQG